MEEDEGHPENGIHAAKDSDRQQRLRLCVLNEILNTERDYVRTLLFLQSVSLTRPLSRLVIAFRSLVPGQNVTPNSGHKSFNSGLSFLVVNVRVRGMRHPVTLYNARLHVYIRRLYSALVLLQRVSIKLECFFSAVTDLLGMNIYWVWRDALHPKGISSVSPNFIIACRHI